MALLTAFWSSSVAITVVFRTLTLFTIICSILLFVLKARQDTLSAKKARAQSFFIAEQAGKILKQELDIATLATEAQRLQQKAELLVKQAVNAERNVADTYDFNGVHRIRRGGQMTAIMGPEVNVFQQMAALEKNQSWDELLSLSQAQLAATPTWLTPYLFAAVAYIQLGNVAEARKLLTHVVQSAGDDPAYSKASQLLSSLPDHPQ